MNAILLEWLVFSAKIILITYCIKILIKSFFDNLGGLLFAFMKWKELGKMKIFKELLEGKNISELLDIKEKNEKNS